MSACDVRFGSAGGGTSGVADFREALIAVARESGEKAVVSGPCETAEIAYDCWKAAVEAGVWPQGIDLTVRLGRDFTVPAAGADEARVCAAALEECRRLAGFAAGAERGAGAGTCPSCFLLEFPLSFAYSLETRRHLDRVLQGLSGLPLAVAFFNASWYSSRVIEGLKARGASLCLMDAPRHPAAPPSIDVVTAPLVYIKFYGRNAKDPLSRLSGYDYGEEELSAWLPRLDVLAAQAERLRVVFAAGRDGVGIGNARRLAAMWRDPSRNGGSRERAPAVGIRGIP